MIALHRKECNFDFYSKQIAEAVNYGEMAKIAVMIVTQQKRDNGGFFFPEGMSKVFWAAYKVRKEEFKEVRDAAVEKIELVLANLNTISELRRAKKKIYDAPITFDDKKRFWKDCDNKIAYIKLSA